MSLSKLTRQRIVKEFAVRHNGHYNAALFLDEVRKTGKKHPAYEWFEWDADKAAQAHQLEQARAFARDLRVTFTVTEISGGKRRVRVRESTMPMVISPIRGRQDGGGYVLVDPKDQGHVDEHCRQAAMGLRAWLGRYADAVKAVGYDLSSLERLASELEKRALLDVKAAS